MLKEYQQMINDALNTVDEVELTKVMNVLTYCAIHRHPILTIGNGGSAAIADHWSCDHTKGVGEDTDFTPNTRNLGCNMSLMTAIANDFSYDEVFSKQIKYAQDDYAVVLAISSSGNSPNIIKGLKQAKEENFGTIAFVGFGGGAVVKENLADQIIHVKCDNYGVVEDCHQILMHVLAQNIRKMYANKPCSSLKL